ncbi:putative transferase [Lupinus albus]|uniref:Putative transferase n=1 Tax=Lupinus albus TaxID=3870 RepID=A0A6A4NRP3_LUPAL|nr:putative transferase [Lupinus albus]
MESELWPNLIMDASKNGIKLALLNARMSERSFKIWSRPVLLPLISLMLSKFSLIVPLGIRFQLLQAPPSIINFSGDLKYVIEDFGVNQRGRKNLEDLRLQLAHKQVWLAASIHAGEEEIILGVHDALMQLQPNIMTIIVPRHPQHGRDIAKVSFLFNPAFQPSLPFNSKNVCSDCLSLRSLLMSSFMHKTLLLNIIQVSFSPCHL